MQALYEGDRERAEAIRHPELDVFEAAALGEVERLRTLLDADPTLVSAWSADGFTPLHYAVFFGDPETVRVLANRGADIETPARNEDFAGRARPLHSAVAARRLDTVIALLEAGADPNAERPGGGTPLEEALQVGDDGLAALLRENGARR
ncbi:MAG: ankyrin repeat domain-containing protein [Gaiellales bacterium]